MESDGRTLTPHRAKGGRASSAPSGRTAPGAKGRGRLSSEGEESWSIGWSEWESRQWGDWVAQPAYSASESTGSGGRTSTPVAAGSVGFTHTPVSAEPRAEPKQKGRGKREWTKRVTFRDVEPVPPAEERTAAEVGAGKREVLLKKLADIGQQVREAGSQAMMESWQSRLNLTMADSAT